MFLYASGEPIPVAASHLRTSLREAMAIFDPSASDPALRQMVVVGHSQGGLLTKILAQDSGLAVWDAITNVPYPASRISPESQALLERAMIFRPEPHVGRLVFIATPHGGSPMADGPLGQLGLALSRPQGITARIGDELEAAYGPEQLQRRSCAARHSACATSVHRAASSRPCAGSPSTRAYPTIRSSSSSAIPRSGDLATAWSLTRVHSSRQPPRKCSSRASTSSSARNA